MQRLRRLFLPTLFVGFISGCGYQEPSKIGESRMSSMTFVSRNGDKEIDFSLSDKEITAQPDWNQDQPPPLAVPSLIGIAAKELPKYTHGVEGWQLESIDLQRLDGPEESTPMRKWVYIVGYMKSNHRDNIRIPITFAGVAIQGQEHPREKRGQEN